MFGIVTSGKDVHDQQINAVDEYDVYDITSNAVSTDVRTTKAIVIHNLVNVLRHNDEDSLSTTSNVGDEISIGIYSDAYDQMFRCGDF